MSWLGSLRYSALAKSENKALGKQIEYPIPWEPKRSPAAHLTLSPKITCYSSMLFIFIYFFFERGQGFSTYSPKGLCGVCLALYLLNSEAVSGIYNLLQSPKLPMMVSGALQIVLSAELENCPGPCKKAVKPYCL